MVEHGEDLVEPFGADGAEVDAAWEPPPESPVVVFVELRCHGESGSAKYTGRSNASARSDQSANSEPREDVPLVVEVG